MIIVCHINVLNQINWAFIDVYISKNNLVICLFPDVAIFGPTPRGIPRKLNCDVTKQHPKSTVLMFSACMHEVRVVFIHGLLTVPEVLRFILHLIITYRVLNFPFIWLNWCGLKQVILRGLPKMCQLFMETFVPTLELYLCILCGNASTWWHFKEVPIMLLVLFWRDYG